jgi:hypothetical protein
MARSMRTTAGRRRNRGASASNSKQGATRWLLQRRRMSAEAVPLWRESSCSFRRRSKGRLRSSREAKEDLKTAHEHVNLQRGLTGIQIIRVACDQEL